MENRKTTGPRKTGARRLSLTTQAVIAVSVLLLALTALLGTLLLNQSKAAMKVLINERMLDISNTSAAMVDGDAFETFTENSGGTPEYQKSYDTLKTFQDHTSLEYIYAVRDMGDGTYTFVVDTDQENPGEYGEPIQVTDALVTAAGGSPAVDAEPYEDAWGKFYSAYSPFFDSRGKVAGILCVDFSADWYDRQVTRYSNTVLLFSLLALFAGASVVFVFTARLRGRLRELDRELTELTGDVDRLLLEIDSEAHTAAGPPQPEETGPEDEIGELGRRVRAMQGVLRRHIDQTSARANGMITALASDYRSVYYIDLDSGEGVCFRAHSELAGGLREGERFSFRQVFTDYAGSYVAECDRAEFLRVIAPENIRRELADESIVAHRYLVVRDGNESYEMLRMAGVRRPEDRTDGKIHAIAVGFTDVDRETRESLLQRQALRDALAAAEEASRAKTAFLSSMSHEIRTPMNAIIGLDSIALSDPELSGRAREALEKIGGSARHLLRLINDILDMSRIESGRMVLKKEEFSLPELLGQINAMADSQCRDKGLRYECHVSGNLNQWYIGDGLKLKQILINILGNAVKFTPAGGSVTLEVKRSAGYSGQSALCFTVADTGIGMDKAFLPKLFDAFSQEDSSTTNKYGSTGLGMAITKSMVDMMNGTIQVESEKGAGSTFTVTLPLQDSDRTAPEPSGPSLPQNLSALVIDDDPVACEHAVLVLEQAGIAAETAPSGAEGVELVRLRHARRTPFDLVLVDWKMPDLDGLETARQLRAILGDQPAVILLTAYNWDDVLQEAKEAGINGFLAKPLSPAAVQEELRAVRRQTSVPEHKAELAGRRVLLAEDMDINAEIMHELLGMRSITAERAENGRIAVDMFAAHPAGWYDAILMDMRMPEMDGLAATAAIRAMDRSDAKTIPIIALTANAFDEDVQRSLQAGLNAHLSKPVEPDSLFSTLESLLP